MYKIYSKDNCGYCDAAKRLLESKGLPYVELKVGRDVTREILLEMVPHARTIPQIFYNDEYIGDYGNLLERLNNDDSSRLLLG